MATYSGGSRITTTTGAGHWEGGGKDNYGRRIEKTWVPDAQGPGTGPGQGNINLPGNFQDVWNQIQQLMIKAQGQSNAARIPGSAGLEEQSSKNIGSALKGQLPADVVNRLRQESAEQAVGRGMVGAPASDASYLRALGLDSLALTNTGQSWLGAAYGRNPGAPVYDPTNLMITPYQSERLRLEQYGINQQASQQALQNAMNWQALNYKLRNPDNNGQPTGGNGQQVSNATRPTNSMPIFTTPTATGGTTGTGGSPPYNPNYVPWYYAPSPRIQQFEEDPRSQPFNWEAPLYNIQAGYNYGG